MDFLRPILGSYFRHALTSVGAVLVAYGVTQGQADSLVSASTEVCVGVGLHFAGLALSALKNIKLAKLLNVNLSGSSY